MNNVNKNFNSKEFNDKVNNRNNLYNNIEEYNCNNSKNSINIIDSDEIKENEKSFFIMTLECENGKFDQIKIYPDSEPEELAFNFCIQNDLDCSTMKYITQEIKELLIQFKKNNDLQEFSEQFFKQQKEIDKNFENEIYNNFDFNHHNKNKIENSNINEKSKFKNENGENLSFKIENDNNIDNKLIEKSNKYNENNLKQNNEKFNDNKSHHSKKSIYDNNKENSIENGKSEHNKSLFEKKSLNEKSDNNTFNEIQFVEENNSNEKEFLSQNDSSELSSSFLSKDTGKKINDNNSIKTNKNENILNKSIRNNNEEKNIFDNNSIKEERRIKKNTLSQNKNLNEKTIKNNIHKNETENSFKKINPTKKYSFQQMNFKINDNEILNSRTFTPIKSTHIINLKNCSIEELLLNNQNNKINEFHLQKDINNIDDLNILEHQIHSNNLTNHQNKKIISKFRKDTNEIYQNDDSTFQRVKTYTKSNLVTNKILKKDSPKKIQFADYDNDKNKINKTIMPMKNIIIEEQKQKNQFTIHNIEKNENEKLNDKKINEEINEKKKEESIISNKNLNESSKERITIEKENKKEINESIKNNNSLLTTRNRNNLVLTSDLFSINNKPLIGNSIFIENKHYIPINEGINYKLIDLYNEDEKSYNSFYSTKTPKNHKKNIKKSNSSQKDLLIKRNISPNVSLSKNINNLKQNNSNTTLLDKNNTSKRSKSSVRKYNKFNYGEYLYKKGLIDKKMKNEKIRKLKLKEEKRIIANCSFSPKINIYHPFKNKSFSNLQLNKNLNNNTTTRINKQKENKINESTKINKISPYNNNIKNNNIKKTKKKPKKITLTKSDLQKIYLKKNLKIIKTESEQNYTFKPKINNNYNCTPGIIFYQRQEIYQQYKKRKDMIKPQTTRINKNYNLSRNKFRPNSTRNHFRDNSNSKSRDKIYTFNSFFSDFSK